MAQKPLQDTKPVVWEHLKWSYGETRMGGASHRPAAGFVLPHFKSPMVGAMDITIFQNMVLAKEEKEKIEEEERIRAEAQAKYAQPQVVSIKKRTSLLTWLVLIFIGFPVLMAIIFSNLDRSSSPSSSPTGVSVSVPVGQNGYLRVAGQKEVLVATTKENMDRLTKAAVANDTYGIAEMVYDGEAFGVQNGTKVLVVDKKFAVSQVRILEGERAGITGWVPYEFVSPK